MDSDKTTNSSSTSELPSKIDCSKCGYSTRNRVLYDNHTCDQHDADSNLDERTLITLTVDEGRRFHCSECDVRAAGHAFEEHLMCHIILKPYQCLYCSQCFVSRRDVGRHVVKVHIGQKMNCALRALKRAKGLMKATQESGSFQFYAGVAGKMPLPGDSEKSKAKQKKSRSEADGSGNKTASKPSVSSEDSVPGKGSSSSEKQSSRDGQEKSSAKPSPKESRENASSSAKPSPKESPENASSSAKPSSKDSQKNASSSARSLSKDSQENASSTSRPSSKDSQENASSSAKPSLKDGQETSSSDKLSSRDVEENASSSLTAAESPALGRMPEDIKGQGPSQTTAGEADRKPDPPSPTSKNSSVPAAEESTDRINPPSCQLTAEAAEPEVSQMDSGSEVVTVPAYLIVNKDRMEDNKTIETVDTSLPNATETTDCASDPDEMGSSAKMCEENVLTDTDQIQTSTDSTKDAVDSSSKLDKSSELDSIVDEPMDVGSENDAAVKPPAEVDDKDSSFARGEPVGSISVEDIVMDSVPKSDDIIDSANKSSTIEDATTAADETSKMDNCTVAKTGQCGDPASEVEPTHPAPSSQNTDAALRLDKSADDPPVSSKTESMAKREGTMDCTPSAKPKELTQAEEESLSPAADQEKAADPVMNKTELSEAKSEEKTDSLENADALEKTDSLEKSDSLENADTLEKSDSLPKTDAANNSAMDMDEPMDTSSTPHDSSIKLDEVDQAKTGDAEEKLKTSSGTSVENENQTGGVDGREKSSIEDEISQNSTDAVTESDKKDADTSDMSRKNGVSSDTANVGSMEVDEAESSSEKNENVTNPSTAESENETETSDNLKPDPTQMDTGCDQPQEDGKDLEFPVSNFDQSEEEESGVGLKIVAAFSLQEDGAKDSSDTVSQTAETAKAAGEKEAPKEAAPDTKEPTPEAAEGAAASGARVQEPVVRTLGPPSKPVPSSSFLGVSPSADPITSQGFVSQQVPHKNVFFFVCGFSCSFSCLTSPEFRDHLMLDHAGESAFRCFHCGYLSSSEDGLVRHISAHAHTYSKSVPLYICGASACKFGSNLVNDFITHQSAWHPELTTFHCHDCDERFDGIEDLLRHFEANFLHIINCPHCTAKTTERRTLLNHISTTHPGKPKMVSVAKQIVCRDRKLNSYAHFMQARNQTAATVSASQPGVEQSGASHSRTKSLVSILTQPIQPQERELTRQAQERELSRQTQERELTQQTSSSAAPNNPPVKVETVAEEEEEFFQESFDDSFDEEEYGIQGQGEITYMGSKPDEREVDNFKCQFCTFIARDRCRLDGHERCHGLPPSRKSRFKCMYCPQGFNNEHKFSSHVSCHPGLIKFSLYCCKFCDFDSNQRHIIIKHVRSTRDQVHAGCESNEEDMYAVLSKTMETRVLECNQCSYMTRHRKHLVAHLKREHSSLRKTGITVDCDIVEKYPSQSIGANRNKALEMALSHDQAAQLPVGDDGFVKENQARRFKCPICQYLVPRAADLKAHVKRHSEIGEITLVMFRCKYCSAASTAREIIYGHLMEKHLGKQIALVKRIVTIDTKGNDNGYAVTSMEDEDGGGEAGSCGEGKDNSASASSKVLVIPDSAGETFPTLMPCPGCAFGSYSRKTIILHVSNHHPDISIMGRRQDNELYPLETTYTTPATTAAGAAAAARFTMGESLKGEILIVPDSQTFDEPILCPKCDYATIHRRNIVVHLEQNHPTVSVMGRNDYPTFDGKGKAAVEANATGKDGMVIIGSGSLDEKIRCLYENFGDRMKCMICQAERPKKFFIHVHILRHLNILLWGCQFCSHKGLQKYKMMDHIKKVHPGRAFCIRYLPVNVEERVNQYLHNASAIRARRSGEEGESQSAAGGSSFPAGVSGSPGSSFPSGGSSFSATSTFPASVTGSDHDLNSLRMKYKASQDRLSGCTIGSEELDMKLACLYSVGSDNRYRCVVCAQEFQRKFAVHRHIVQSHLKVNLIGCGYCDLEGVERHIMMDHIIETHKNAPISMRNLAQNLENKVAEFLSRMTLAADDTLDLPASDLGMDSSGEFKLPEPPQMALEAGSSPKRATPPPRPSSSSSNSSGGKNQLNPNLLLLGRDILHRRLASMIRESGSTFCCQVCKWDFPRKYAVHRHILMKHLKVGIIGCPYCSFEGVERYQVFTHIREDHKEAELSLRYLSVDLDTHVAQFMESLANGTADLYNKAPPPWSMKKMVKKEAVSDEDSQEAPSTEGGSQGLVVAMFGKRSALSIKEEPKDEDEDTLGLEPLDREVNGEDSNATYDLYLGGEGGEGEREVSSTSLLAANGTKAKVATDVQTNIRVITIKEKGFKRHICEKCKFTSLHRSNIVRHIYRVHEQYREHECPICNYKTLSRVLIEQHITNEHPGTPLPEIVGSRGIKRKIDMSHEELEYDSMKKCKAAATSKRREADLPLLNSTSTQLYACAYCNFETMTHSQIVQHTRENHPLGQPMKAKEEGEEEGGEGDLGQPGNVPEDALAFESAINIVKMNDGEGETAAGSQDTLWQCFYCSFKTTGEEDIKIHFAETHPGNVYRAKKVPAWRFVCRSCHVKTRAHSKMRYHLNRHINYRPYTCTTCGSFYPSPDQCRKHCRANSHNETFTYVKIPRKERRLQELLKECQEIAAAMARNPASADAYLPSPTLSQPIPSKRKAKKSFSAHSRVSPAKMRKNYEYDAPYSPRGGASSTQGQREDRPKDDSPVMVCACCDFSAQNVCDVWLHFIKEHEEQEFRWLDSSTGYICTETGEITNAKDNPPDLEAPPGPGYTMMSSRLLNCEHCEFTTSTVQAMKSHLRRHLPKRYLCPYCSLRCSRRDTITQHVRCGHKGRELWTIFFRLPEGFVADSDNAESNLDSAGPGSSSQANDGEDSPVAGGSTSGPHHRIKCGQCDMQMGNVAAIYNHHRGNHPDLDFLWVDVTNGYSCNHSGVVIDAREQAPHLFTQDGYSVEHDGSGSMSTYCCKFCAFTSAFVQAIKSHMKSHLPHGFMCPYCCMSTNSKEKMMSHQSCMHREMDPWILHLRMPSESSSAAGAPAISESAGMAGSQARGVTQYTCNACDYSSNNLYQYRLHLANHGSFPHLVKDVPDDLPFRCGYCVYVAEDEGDFGAHIASHLERRNFRCSKCQYTAFKRSAVQTHIQTTHDETEEIEVIDLQASNVSEQGGSLEEPQLVNLEPKVKVVPVNDLDLDREGLTLFSPSPTPDEEGREMNGEGEGVSIIGAETPSLAELDNQSDSTEEWGDGGGEDEDNDNEGSPNHSPSSASSSAAKRSGNSILRLTLQGKLTGEYGIKRAVPVDNDGGDLTDASASRDSALSAASDNDEEMDNEEDPSMDNEEDPSMDNEEDPSMDNEEDPSMDNEEDPSIDAVHDEEEDLWPEQPEDDEEEDPEVENDDDEGENGDDNDNNNDEHAEIDHDETAEPGNEGGEEEDGEMEHELVPDVPSDMEEDLCPDIDNSVGFEPLEDEEGDEVDRDGEEEEPNFME